MFSSMLLHKSVYENEKVYDSLHKLQSDIKDEVIVMSTRSCKHEQVRWCRIRRLDPWCVLTQFVNKLEDTRANCGGSVEIITVAHHYHL